MKREFELSGDHITLGQFLKAIGQVGTGGSVREYLSTGNVAINGQQEERRGRKLYAGDVVELHSGERIVVTAPQGATHADEDYPNR